MEYDSRSNDDRDPASRIRGNRILEGVFGGMTVALGALSVAGFERGDGIGFWMGMCTAAGTVVSGVATYVSWKQNNLHWVETQNLEDLFAAELPSQANNSKPADN